MQDSTSVEDSATGTTERLRSWAGSAGIFLGIAVLGLLLLDAEEPLPIAMPRSWYANRPLWVIAGLAGLVGGWIALRDRTPASERHSGEGDTPFQSVTLYTRAGCHLCDVAKEQLGRYRRELPPIAVVDIDVHPELRERFDQCVPVVEIDGKVRFRGRVDEILLRRLIAGKSAQS